MSNFQQFTIESRVTQYQRDLMAQAAVERNLKALRAQQKNSNQEYAHFEQVLSSPYSFRLRRAWSAFAGFVAAYL